MTTNLIAAIVLLVVSMLPLWIMLVLTIRHGPLRVIRVGQIVSLATFVLTGLICLKLSTIPDVPVIFESPLMKKARIDRIIFNKRYR